MTRIKFLNLFCELLFLLLIFSVSNNAYSEYLVDNKKKAYYEWKGLGYQLLSESATIESLAKKTVYEALVNTALVFNMSETISLNLKADIFNQDEKLQEYQKDISSSEISTFTTQLMGINVLKKEMTKNILLADAIYWDGKLSSNIFEISSNLLRNEVRFDSKLSHFLKQVSLRNINSECLATSASLIADGLKVLIEISPRNSRTDRLKVKEIIELIRSNRQAALSNDLNNECIAIPRRIPPRDFCKTYAIKGSREYFRKAAQEMLSSFDITYPVLMFPRPPKPEDTHPSPYDPTRLHITTPDPEEIKRENLRTAAFIELSAIRDFIIDSIGGESECSPYP